MTERKSNTIVYRFPPEKPCITPGIIKLMARISDGSIRSFKERKEAGEKYRIALREAAAAGAALTPEERAARKRAEEEKLADEEWDRAVNTAFMTAWMRSQGYDV